MYEHSVCVILKYANFFCLYRAASILWENKTTARGAISTMALKKGFWVRTKKKLLMKLKWSFTYIVCSMSHLYFWCEILNFFPLPIFYWLYILKQNIKCWEAQNWTFHMLSCIQQLELCLSFHLFQICLSICHCILVQ